MDPHFCEAFPTPLLPPLVPSHPIQTAQSSLVAGWSGADSPLSQVRSAMQAIESPSTDIHPSHLREPRTNSAHLSMVHPGHSVCVPRKRGEDSRQQRARVGIVLEEQHFRGLDESVSVASYISSRSSPVSEPYVDIVSQRQNLPCAHSSPEDPPSAMPTGLQARKHANARLDRYVCVSSRRRALALSSLHVS